MNRHRLRGLFSSLLVIFCLVLKALAQGDLDPSTNADLSALTLGTATINEPFVAANTSYSSSVSNLTSSITVTPTTAQSNASIQARIGNNVFASVTSGSPSVALALEIGLNVIQINVTAQDGVTTKTYSISVTRSNTLPGNLDSLKATIVGSYVNAITVQLDGKIMLAGQFTSVLGVPRNNIARLNVDGTLDMGFDPKPNNVVNCVAVQPDGKILLSGQFTSMQPNGSTIATQRNRIARLNADGTLETGFNPNANNTINCMAIQEDGKILIGGHFTSLQPSGAVGTTTRNYVARVHADGTVDSVFNPNVNYLVNSIVVQADGAVLLGGEFTSLRPNGVGTTTMRNYIARVSADGTLDTSFNPSPNDLVYCIAVQPDGKILFGGRFNNLSPNGAVYATFRYYIARLNANGSLDASFDPELSDPVVSLSVQADGKVLLGGNFFEVDSTRREHIARLESDGTLDTSLVLSNNGSVSCLALNSDGRILMGGYFTLVRNTSTSRTFFARLANDPAHQTLSAPNAEQVIWTRSGSAPEVTQVTFELSTDGGKNYTPLLGKSTRVSTTANWQLNGLALPNTGQLRARALTTGGRYNGSSSILKQDAEFSRLPEPEISVTENAANIADGGVFAFGTTDAPTVVTKTFTVTNNGKAPLNLSNLTVPLGFTIAQNCASTVSGNGGTTTFQVKMN